VSFLAGPKFEFDVMTRNREIDQSVIIVKLSLRAHRVKV